MAVVTSFAGSLLFAVVASFAEALSAAQVT